MASNASEAMKRMLRTRGALAAAATAGGVGVYLVASDLVTNLISFIGVPLEQVGGFSWLGYFGYGFATRVVPFVLGFFFSLWVVAPMAEALGLGHVITRGVLAVGIGATVAFVVRALSDIVTSITFGGPLFANSFPGIEFGQGIPFYLGDGLKGAMVLFISVLPLGVLAGILLWHWRKANPPKFHVEGLIDV